MTVFLISHVLCNVTLPLPHQAVEVNSSPLESRPALGTYITISRIFKCGGWFQRLGRKGHTPFAQFLKFLHFLLSRNPAIMPAKLNLESSWPTYQICEWRSLQETSVFNHFESSPIVQVSLAEASDDAQQRQSTVLFLKSWPTESVSIKTIFFYTTKFGVVFTQQQ